MNELVKRLRRYVATERGQGHGADLEAEAADAIERLQKMIPRWIPVTERLPKGGDKDSVVCENVWLLFDDGNVYPGWMNGITEKAYHLNDRDDCVVKAPISRVKMWQPKPEPPKEE